ncbi:MAG TPA: alpha-L-fucosidase [Fimbriimonadaceae bacterium]|nr:alpha-L-fucosidase [Fimbriimonadaceae bacterium]
MLLPALAALAMMPAQTPRIPVPSARQLEWQKLEYYAFVHFGPNTFTDKEWGEGKEDPNLFNPTQLDCRQWVRTFKEAGMKQVIITAKHHDGFCLWPSQYSTHTVAQSKWRDGKGDVLAELRRACNEYGMKMGVYLSPWDRNHPKYGTSEYNHVFANMLKEVLTKYGPIYEVWFDGANGEGPNGKKQVYDWPLFISTVRKYAPDAVIFSDNGPDIRWVGNESGIAGETNWSTIDRSSPKSAIGAADTKYLNTGDPDGKDWVPAECDVSIRPGWFYHADQDNRVKTPEQLLDLWEKSVGRNGSLLLNVPPDRRGLIHENDVKSLMAFKKLRDESYRNNVLKDARAAVSTERGDYPEASLSAFLRSSDFSFNPASVQIRLPKSQLVDRFILAEDLSKGQSVVYFKILAKLNGEMKEIASGTTVGAHCIVPFNPVTAQEFQILYASNGFRFFTKVEAFATPAAKLQADKNKRMAWFRDAKFGMFIHWGLYSQPAGVWNGKNIPGAAEWLLNTAQIKVADYEPLIKTFNPVRYHPKEWVRIAKNAGMKYIVITSKHHEGFGLWPSKQGDWNIASTPYKKDLLKPLAQACKEAGIRLCFYHSIMDWHHPDYLPRRSWDPRPEQKADFERYVRYMKAQLKELLTDYGPIGILWFDGEWESTWTHERGKDLYNYVRKLQPNIIINNRVDTGRSGMQGMNQDDGFVGDYGTPEQEIPANGFGPGVDWESCMTMNDTWGFSSHDHNWKSSAKLVQNLIDCVSKGGNYLLNVGPTAEGLIPQPSIERLAQVGNWTSTYGESIYGAQASPFPKQLPWGRVTRKGDTWYCHIFDPAMTEIELTGVRGAKFSSAREIASTRKGSIRYGSTESGPTVMIGSDTRPKELASLPRVIAIKVQDAHIETPIPKQAADGSLDLKAIDAKLNGGLAYESDKDCIGYWTNPKDTVEWQFAAVRGEVNVEIELACPADSAGANYEIQIGGEILRGTVPTTGSWSTFKRISLGKVSLVVGGPTKLTVVPKSKPGLGVMNLRAIRLRRA